MKCSYFFLLVYEDSNTVSVESQQNIKKLRCSLGPGSNASFSEKCLYLLDADSFDSFCDTLELYPIFSNSEITCLGKAFVFVKHCFSADKSLECCVMVIWNLISMVILPGNDPSQTLVIHVLSRAIICHLYSEFVKDYLLPQSPKRFSLVSE